MTAAAATTAAPAAAATVDRETGFGGGVSPAIVSGLLMRVDTEALRPAGAFSCRSLNSASQRLILL